MELFGEYFFYAVGIAVAMFLICNIAMMAAPDDENVAGWTDDKQLWTVKAILIGLPYCFLISAIGVIAYAVLGILPAVVSQFMVAVLIAAIVMYVIGKIKGQRRHDRLEISDK